jgi:hypothetical protein
MSNFFDLHDRFVQANGVGAWPLRLNLRHAAIVERHRSLFQGAKVLDIASHDGRWSLAALRAGARHVTGVEVRPDLVKAADDNMAAYGVPNSRYRFVCADAIETPFESGFDLVLCLGYFYHTLHHVRLIENMISTGASAIIVDSMVATGDGMGIEIRAEEVDNPANGYSRTGERAGTVLIGYPTLPALSLMFSHYGFAVEYVDWNALLAEHGVDASASRYNGPENPVADYAFGERATALAYRP